MKTRKMNSLIVKNAFVAVALTVIAGCDTPKFLMQREEIPQYITQYSSPVLVSKTKDVCCSLNMMNCVETAVIGVKTLSGKTEPDQEYPVRDIVKAEFDLVISSNFTPVKGDAQPQMELKIESKKAVLTRDGKDLKFDYSAAIMLVNPRHEDKPYFSKIFTAKTRGVRSDKVYVPDCVYEAIQITIKDFLNEVSSDQSLVSLIDSLTP